MARPKGDGRGRLGGRVKGTPNKTTSERKKRITEFIEGHWDEFEAAFKKLDPKEMCSTYMGMMQYYAPKLAAVEYKDKDKPKTFKDELDELSGEMTRK